MKSINQQTIKSVAIYSRKSKYTGKGESIENQINECKEYLKAHFGYDGENINVDVYKDEHVIIGTSGENLVKSRGSALVPFSFLLRDKPKSFKSLKIINERL